jgi:hypothetical protein
MTKAATCSTGKRQYRSQRAAKLAHTKAHFRVRPYRCDECGLWHAANHEKEGAARGR